MLAWLIPQNVGHRQQQQCDHIRTQNVQAHTVKGIGLPQPCQNGSNGHGKGIAHGPFEVQQITKMDSYHPRFIAPAVQNDMEETQGGWLALARQHQEEPEARW